MSNNGRVGVGVIACRESMPDVDDLAQRFPTELARLREVVRRQSTSPPSPAAGRPAASH
jgi:diacylglycerol O-acyltransferase